MTDMLSGRVQIMNGTATSVLPHVKAGRLRALSTSLPVRSPLLPELPSIVEAGQSGLHRVAREPYELGDGARADHEWASMPAMSERAALLADLLLRLL